MKASRFCTTFFYLLAISCCSSVAKAQQPDANEILEATGVKGGLIVHIGCGDGTLTAALHANDSYIVHGLDANAANIEQAREHIRSLGLYGQVSVEHWTKNTLPYAENLLNLVVSEDLGGISMDEVMRVLAPKGVAYIKSGGEWNKTVKPWPDNIDEWTHFLHGANNNAVADDELVGPPRRMQWVAKPLWLRSHETPSGVSALVSTGGRVFYIFDEGIIGITDERLPDTWSLIARDAFNGVKLWEKSLDGWGWSEWDWETYAGKDWTIDYPKRTSAPSSVARRLVADGNQVYVTLGYWAPLSVLDAATGEVIRTIEETLGTDEVLYSDGIVLLSIRNLESETAKRRGETVSQRLLALAAETGEILWETPINSVTKLSLAIEGNLAFCRCSKGVVGLDLNTGEEIWSDSNDTTTVQTLVVHNGVVLVSDQNKLRALSAETGQLLWTYVKDADKSEPKLDLFVANGLIWRGIEGTGLDLLTGAELVKLSTTNLRSKEHHHRCYRGKATQRYIISAKEGIEFLDLNGVGEINNNSRNNWLRGACKYGIMPCNGFVYVPPDQCFCEPGVKLLGFTALAAEANEPNSPTQGRLETGPAYGEPNSPPPGQEDWPTYRHDASRSGSTSVSVAPGVQHLWKVPVAGKISAPVVAEGKVFVAAVDEHTVHALDAEYGTLLWSYTAGGRVDSPPTIFEGMALFGATDGWVYCLRASDGELVWRFRAAPVERRIGSFGQVESAWPVHGSVLVQNGVVYFSAGRSSFLDGGVRVYGLDPLTGNVLYEARLEGPYEDLTKDAGHSFFIDGTRNDILIGDGNFIYLGQAQLDNELVKQDCAWITELGDREMGLHVFSTAGFLDDSWYNRAYWMHSGRWPGFYIANQAPKSGQLLVFDETHTYAVKVFTRRNRHSPMFFPATDGYLLFADEYSNEPQLVDANGEPEPVEWLPQSSYQGGSRIIELTDVAVNKDKWIGFTRSQPPLWTEWMPVRVRAMVKAADTVFVAGPPDVFDPNDPLGAFDGRKGTVLWSVSAADGKKLAKYNLESLPVWDGMAAANGRLYISMQNGEVQCLIGTNWPPKVDAGQDRSIYPMAPAILDANVIDDGLPLVDPCDPNSEPVGVTARWTKIDGPGDVNFADPCAADTTAVFSQWGKYILRIDAFDGGASYYDDIDIFVCRPGDLDKDNDVDILDIGLFAEQWLMEQCGEPNEWCHGADQAAGGSVDFDSYAIVAANWLAGVYPAPPEELTAEPGDGAISLDWDDNTEVDLAGYNVYRSISHGSGYTKLNGSLLTDSDYLDTSASNCITYYYVVTAEDTFGYNSSYSGEVSASPGTQPVMKLIAGIGVTTVGTDVSEWQDQANNNDAIADADANRPELIPSAINGEPAIEFDGTGEHLDVADNANINTGGPYSAKTLVVVFKTSSDIGTRQIIWEQGGGTRGLSFYLDSGNLYINGWNRNETVWEPTGLNTPVSTNTAYIATLVMDAVAGTFEGFVNSTSIDSNDTIAELYAHSDDCAFGHVEGGTKFHDGSTSGPADFAGQIAEFYEFNAVLSSTDRQTLENFLMSKYGIGG